MAYTNIDDPSAHFQTFTYTGNQSGRQITLDGNSDLQPDLYWYKARNANHHYWVDSSRGTTKYIYSSLTSAEATVASAYVTSFNTNGFGVGGGDSGTNANGISFGNWAWKANGGTTASNTDGSITTTTQVNSDAGFSIVTWAGGGTGSLGHGLGVVPDMWIVKNRDYAVSWAVGFSDSSFLGGTSNYLSLNTTQAILTYNNLWGSSPANSSTITMAGDRLVNISGNNYVGYFFKAKQGYSKFGKYVGNGNANGTFVYTGFKPAFVMIKDVSRATNWEMFDHKRNPSNVANLKLGANLAVAENGSDLGTTSQNNIDMLSNGFKMRTGNTDTNLNGDTFIYMAFAENSLVSSSGVPCTAK